MRSATASHRPVIKIAAALIVNEAGQALVVRKRGTRFFMQAGGKIEPGETPLAALARELTEELGLDLGPGPQEHLGKFVAEAANETDHLVEAEVFYVRVGEPVAPAAEIETAIWIDPARILDLPLAPLTRQLMPIAEARAAARGVRRDLRGS